MLLWQYHALICSDLVAITLTSTAPRVWILTKALSFAKVDTYNKRYREAVIWRRGKSSTGDSAAYSLSYHHTYAANAPLREKTMHHIGFEDHGLSRTRWSHPNLEAAWKLIRNVYKIMARAGSSFAVV